MVNFPAFSRQLCAKERVDDGAGVNIRDRPVDLEDLVPFDEEGTQLWEEQGEALIDLDLRKIGLDLREVRVEGEIGNQVGGDAVLDVDTAFGVAAAAGELSGLSVQGTEVDSGESGQELEVPAGRKVGHALEHAELPHEALDVSRHWGPDNVLAVVLPDLAHELKAPPVWDTLRHAGIAEALEGDGHFGSEPVLDDLGRRLEEGVPRAVGERNARTPIRAPTGHIDDPVALHVVRVHVEIERTLLVHERIEIDRQQVVLRRLVSIHSVCAHDAGV